MAFSHVYWQALTGFAVLFFGLGTAAAAAAAQADKGSISLPIFLFTNAGLLCAAAVFVQKRRNPLEIPDVGVGEALIVAGGASLYIQIAVRLCAASASFGGTIGRFDFGLKCGYRNATAGVESCSESNEAFEPEFNSFGHTMQGFLSFLLFPVLANALCNRIPQRNATWRPTLRHALSTASCWVVFYPVYNIIKRTVKDDKYNEGVKAWKAFAVNTSVIIAHLLLWHTGHCDICVMIQHDRAGTGQSAKDGQRRF